ncbi:hypothetical protein [Crossiella equi]|nr:hypothetical protein [Crossiella equi]
MTSWVPAKPGRYVRLSPGQVQDFRYRTGLVGGVLGLVGLAAGVTSIGLGMRLPTTHYLFGSWAWFLAAMADLVLVLTGFVVLNPGRHLRADHLDVKLVRRTREGLGVLWGLSTVLVLGSAWNLASLTPRAARDGFPFNGVAWAFVVLLGLTVVLGGVAYVLGRRAVVAPPTVWSGY